MLEILIWQEGNVFRDPESFHQFSAPPSLGHLSGLRWLLELQPSGAYARSQGGGQGEDSHIILSGDSVAIHIMLPGRSNLGQLGLMPILEEGGEDGC